MGVALVMLSGSRVACEGEVPLLSCFCSESRIPGAVMRPEDGGICYFRLCSWLVWHQQLVHLDPVHTLGLRPCRLRGQAGVGLELGTSCGPCSPSATSAPGSW